MLPEPLSGPVFASLEAAAPVSVELLVFFVATELLFIKELVPLLKTRTSW